MSCTSDGANLTANTSACAEIPIVPTGFAYKQRVEWKQARCDLMFARTFLSSFCLSLWLNCCDAMLIRSCDNPPFATAAALTGFDFASAQVGTCLSISESWRMTICAHYEIDIHVTVDHSTSLRPESAD
eukprot:SAG31_NODE_5212_length_2673_cov_2.442890_2_plen_129_part_00